MDGLILVRKPPRLTSHDVVARLRKIIGQKKLGHFGTLDPLATGLLIAAAGKATRLFPYFGKMDKAYEGRIRLGFSTDTYDSDGQPASAPTDRLANADAVAGAMARFTGDLWQLPPLFSAKKLRGKPLYAYARRRMPVDQRPCRLTIREFALRSYAPPELEFSVRCSSGTYIRSLAHDLGQALGCGGHLTELVRTEIGEFTLAEALTLEEIGAFQAAGNASKFLRPMEALLPLLPKILLTEEGARRVRNGRFVEGLHVSAGGPDPAALPPGDPVRLFTPEHTLLALARPALPPALFAPFLVFG